MGEYLIGTADTKTGAIVRLYEVAAGLNVADVIAAYVITSSTGYRATLPACLRDECRGDGPLIACTRPLDDRGQHANQSVNNWCKHIQTHCHGTHEAHARVFMGEVVATYGGAGRRETSLAGLLAHPARVRNVSVKMWAGDPWRMQAEGVAQ